MLDLQFPQEQESVHLTSKFHHLPRVGLKQLCALHSIPRMYPRSGHFLMFSKIIIFIFQGYLTFTFRNHHLKKGILGWRRYCNTDVVISFEWALIYEQTIIYLVKYICILNFILQSFSVKSDTFHIHRFKIKTISAKSHSAHAYPSKKTKLRNGLMFLLSTGRRFDFSSEFCESIVKVTGFFPKSNLSSILFSKMFETDQNLSTEDRQVIAPEIDASRM